jgi:hypothetical protein
MTDVPSTIVEWERNRARLSHDQLKNEFVPLLSKSIRIVEGRVHDDVFESTLAERVPEVCGVLCNSVLALVDGMVASLTPAAYLGVAPLNNLDPDSRRWLSEVIEATWLENMCIERIRDDVRDAVDGVKRQLRALDRFSHMSKEEKLASLNQLLVSVRELGFNLGTLKNVMPYPI